MLQNKSTILFSEVKGFFTSSEKAANTIFHILQSVKLSKSKIHLPDDIRIEYKPNQVVLMLLLFPMLHIKNVCNYVKSPVSAFFDCGKDVFYRLKNNEFINWRILAYSINLKLIRLADAHGETNKDNPGCLIVDDSDLSKTGRRMEFIGKIWSHVSNRCILGYKGLYTGYFDGKSFWGLDFSLHGEKGKNEKKPFGLSKKQLKERFSKKREKDSAGYTRVQEYFQAKTETMKSMIKTAIAQGIRFEYLLVDSWFISEALILFVLSRKIGCHLLGMAKMNKTKYSYNSKELTAKEIVEDLKRKKKTKKSKLLNVWFASTVVEYRGVQLKLFFCKTTHKGKWNVLLTTKTSLEFEQAYKIYSIRWTIEVFFKESKQHFSLGECQSRDFDGQIADTTISLLQYNTLVLAKRFLDYESIGGLFKQAKAESLMLTIAEQIWKYIIEILQVIAELFEIDLDFILEKLLDENQVVTKLLNLNPLKNAS